MLDFVIDALASHRLTKLVIDDNITEDLREKWFEKFGQPDETKLGYLITCPWCAGMWIGFGVVAARTIAPEAWRPLSYALALSTITGLAEEHL